MDARPIGSAPWRRRALFAGGGALADFAMRRGIPVAETIAGKASLSHDHPCAPGMVGVLGRSPPTISQARPMSSWPSARSRDQGATRDQALQWPLPDSALRIVAIGEKKT